jgi:hypothetical protein
VLCKKYSRDDGNTDGPLLNLGPLSFSQSRSTFDLTASKLFDTSAARHLFEKEMTRLNRCDFPFDGAVACIDLTYF